MESRGYVGRGPYRVLAPAVLVAVMQSFCQAAQVPAVRIKDIAVVAGTGGQQVMGYGLVVGLEGTGDTNKSLVTAQALGNMLENFDLKLAPNSLATRNVAAVIVTASLPATAREGDSIDVTVASVGDATSLFGGILLPTPLIGNDREIYAVAHGPVSIGGMNAAAGGEKIQKNHPVSGRVVGGGRLVKALAPSLQGESLFLTLRQPDFTTALRISAAINQKLGAPVARALAAESVEVKLPADRQGDIVGFIAELEGLPVVSDTAARVVVNERTGTIIIGGDVRIMPVAVAHGNLKITVSQRYEVSQPPPFTETTTVVAPQGPGGEKPGQPDSPARRPGEPGPGRKPERPTVPELPGARTVVTPRTEVSAEEEEARLVAIEPQTRLSDLVEALNMLGVKPRDLIAILQALKTANALQAELVVM